MGESNGTTTIGIDYELGIQCSTSAQIIAPLSLVDVENFYVVPPVRA